MVSIAGVSAIIGTILAILTFYYSTYLPYIQGNNTAATKAFTPVLRAIPGAEAQHIRNSPTPTQPPPGPSPPSAAPPPGPSAPRPPGENVDRTPPDIFVPEDMTVEATGPDGAEVSFEEEPSATDDVDGPVAVTCDYNSGATFPIVETIVTCSAEDSARNAGQKSFTVTVQDTTPPDICDDNDITVEAAGPDGAEVSFEVCAEDDVDGSATLNADGTTTQDDIGGDITISCVAASGLTFPIGATEDTCTAADAAGNAGEESFTVTVEGANVPGPEQPGPDSNVTESG
jgi:hypothetical protein